MKASNRGKKSPAEPAQKKGPVREVIDQCPHRNVGSIDYGDKTLYPADWESPWERGLIHLLLQCHDVKTIETQSEKFTYQLDGKEHQYTLDLAITMTSLERVSVEVKSRKYLLEEKALRKYLAIAASFRARGRQLDFITEDQLNKVWLRSARLLKRYFFTEIEVLVQLDVERILDQSELSIASLLEALGPRAAVSDIYALISSGRICIDWDVPLNRQAMVSLPDKPYRRLSYADIRHSGRFPDLLEEISVGRRPADQRRLAYARTWRRPLLPPSPYGFVDGFSPSQLGRLGRLATRQRREVEREAALADGAHDRVVLACEEGD